MGIKQNSAAKGTETIAYPSNAGEVVRNRFIFAVAAGVAIAAGDILEIGCIPANCEVVDIIIDSDAIDTGGSPALVADVGIMSGEWGDEDQDRTCGAEFFSATDVLQAGGVARPTLASAFRTTKSDRARSIGIKVTTAAATQASGTIGLTVLVAA